MKIIGSIPESLIEIREKPDYVRFDKTGYLKDIKLGKYVFGAKLYITDAMSKKKKGKKKGY